MRRAVMMAMGILGGRVLASGYSISGNVGVADATIALGALSTTSAGDGSYTLDNIPVGTDGTLTITKSGYAFYPTRLRIRAMSASLTGKNFSATQLTITYYVRTTGNDTTGNGSDALPWATFNKAATTIPTGGAATLKIGNGTYSVTFGNGFVNRAFTNQIVVEPESGVLGDVILNSAGSSTTGFTIISSNKITFKKIAFSDGAAGRMALWMQGNTNQIEFIDCSFSYSCQDATLGNRWGCAYIQPAVNQTMQNVTFDGCSFNIIGVQSCSWHIKFTTTNTAITNMRVTNCTFSDINDVATGASVWFNCPTTAGASMAGVEISNNTITSTTPSHVIMVGDDLLAQGVISDVAIYDNVLNGTSHVVQIGFGVNGCVIDNNTVIGSGVYGLVIKECTDVEISNNTIAGGSDSAILYKAAITPNAHDNTITVTQGGAFRLANNNIGLNKCADWQFQNNIINVSGAGKALNIGNDTHDAGGGICDYNTYQNNSGLGVVRNDAAVANLAELQAAWADYDVTTNDSHSTVT